MTALLQLRSLVCNEPATSFRDDIEIFVNGISAGGQFPIDKGQFRDLSGVRFDFDGQAEIDFKENSDPAKETVVLEALAEQGVQEREVQIKSDGRYVLFFEAIPTKIVGSRARIQLRSLLCNEPATSLGDDIEISVNGISASGQFSDRQGPLPRPQRL
jgi:hypothetical protein